MHHHRWKILIGIALVFVGLTGIELAMVGSGPEKEVEAYKKSLIANGEKLQISELVPPPVAPEQNGADIVKDALGLLRPEDDEYSNSIPAMQMIGPGKAIVCFEQPDVRDLQFTNSWENELAVLTDDEPMTEFLTQATNYPVIDFPLDYEDWSGTEKYAVPLLSAANRLSAKAVCDLRQGDIASARTDISTTLAIVKRLDDVRLERFQNVRIFMTWLAAEVTWEFLQSSNVNDMDLALLQTNWEQPKYVHAMENAFAMQRAFGESEILKMRTSKQYFNDYTKGGEEDVDWSDGWGNAVRSLANNAKFACAKSAYRASWTYSDELHMIKEYEIIVQTLRTVETNECFFPAYTRMTNELSSYWADEPDGWLAKWDNNDLHRMFSVEDFEEEAVSRTFEAEATRRIVITAIALKRYHLKNGSYPSSLADLTPQFVSSVPRDPIDGKPLRYRSMPGGSFLLYSVGLNGKDDGGDGSLSRRPGYDSWFRLTSPGALDWVWPQPATPAGIEAFYAHPPPNP